MVKHGLTNLNESTIDSDFNYPQHETTLQPHRVTENCVVETCFRDLEDRLIEEIERSHYVIGCVAWLTNERILKALASIRGVSIVVQKEDFLRPDLASNPGWANRLRALYKDLRPFGDRHLVGGLVSYLSVCGDPTLDPVRCVGNYNSDKYPAFPRMHNKFVIFCDPFFAPYKVWTGSFNFTYNGTYSLENAVLIQGEQVANAYYEEWEQILALSEPLNWEHEWMAPEWRIGT